MDERRFLQACEWAADALHSRGGIGTLGEKTLHAALKAYFEPQTDNHEVKIGGYVADIVGEDGIIEVQTRSFERLRGKLAAFLPVADVTVVYPVAHIRRLCWVEPSTGDIVSRRKGRRVGAAVDAFYELYKIKPLLTDPRLHLCIVLVDVDEYRLLDGWSKDKKRGSTRHERIPTGLADVVWVRDVRDYGRLIPDALPESFTAKDLAGCAGVSVKTAQVAVNVLHSVGAVVRDGKRGNAYVYTRRMTED